LVIKKIIRKAAVTALGIAATAILTVTLTQPANAANQTYWSGPGCHDVWRDETGWTLSLSREGCMQKVAPSQD